MKQNLIKIYLLWLVLTIVPMIIFQLVPAAATIGIFGLIFGLIFFTLPGWLINRFLKVKSKTLFTQILISFALSLGFYIFVNLLAIIIGVTISQLLNIYLVLLVGLFIGAFIYDYLKKPDIKLTLKLDQSLIWYLVPLVVSIMVVILIDAWGANFNGDPYYHLAIVRKAVSNLALNSQNLSYSISAPNNPAYALPAWHILVAIYSKILKTDIFNAWGKINLTLVVFALLTFWELIKKLFPNRIILSVTFLVSIFFIFYAGPGYFFQRLVVPDTFAQFVLVPIGLIFSLNYIFKGASKLIWPIVILNLVLLDVHAIHFEYYLIILIFFALVISVVTLFKDKEMINQSWKLVGINCLILVLAAILLQARGGFLSQNVQSFLSAPVQEISYPTFKYFQITFKIGLVLLPLIIILGYKKPSLIVVTSFLLAPIIYWTYLKNLTTSLLSFIFTDRLLANVGWYYFVIGAVLGMIFVILEILLARVKRQKVLDLVVISVAIFLIIIEILWHPFSNLIYQGIFSIPTLKQNNAWALPLFIVCLILAASYLVYQKLFKKDLIDWSKPGSPIYLLSTSLIVWCILFPVIGKDQNFILDFKLFAKNPISSAGAASLSLNTQVNIINFIKTNLPAKSTILANPEESRNLSLFVDQHMVYNQGTSWAGKFKKVFNGSFNAQTTQELINDPKYKIDYIIVSQDDLIARDIFNQPEYKLIYGQEVKIYQIVKP